MLINNAGIQRVEDLTSGKIAHAEATINNTNLLGPIRITAALIQPAARGIPECLFGTRNGACSDASKLLRKQSCHPFLHSIPALSTQEYVHSGRRNPTAVGADRIAGITRYEPKSNAS